MEVGTRSGSMEFEYRYHHPEHGLRWLSCRGRRLDTESRMLGVILDITVRKQAELGSAAQHELSRALAGFSGPVTGRAANPAFSL